MAIWKDPRVSVAQINSMNPKTLLSALNIEFVSLGDDFIEARMPVDHRTHQPAGILHGGASVVLAESLGSVGSVLVAGTGKACVGIEVNASHLGSIQTGFVIGKATPIRLGRQLHVWTIEIRDEADQRPICTARLTVMVKDLGDRKKAS